MTVHPTVKEQEHYTGKREDEDEKKTTSPTLLVYLAAFPRVRLSWSPFPRATDARVPCPVDLNRISIYDFLCEQKSDLLS